MVLQHQENMLFYLDDDNYQDFTYPQASVILWYLL
jgi:hypothetical protein